MHGFDIKTVLKSNTHPSIDSTEIQYSPLQYYLTYAHVSLLSNISLAFITITLIRAHRSSEENKKMMPDLDFGSKSTTTKSYRSCPVLDTRYGEDDKIIGG